MDKKDIFSPYFSENFNKTLKRIKKKDKEIFQRISESVFKIINNPLCGKPLRNVLRNYRRVHIGHFVLIYEIINMEIRFLDFDHHDKIYKK
mgnify:CR=1